MNIKKLRAFATQAKKDMLRQVHKGESGHPDELLANH